MALKLDVVGMKGAPVQYRYGWKDTVLYALGVGARADELDFLLELSGPKVLPTFAVVPSFGQMMTLCNAVGADPAMIVHGEQVITLHGPIPPAATVTSVAEVTGIYDKGKGALIAVLSRTSDERGAPLFDNQFTIFVRGAGGFGGDRGPEALRAEPPSGKAPDFSVSERTTPEQALLYRLSGDLNPLHASPSYAKLAGFDRPILQGLCTYGFAGRAFLAHACGGDPARFQGLAARFAGIVFPGDTLTTEGWLVEPGQWVLRTKTQDDRVVLSNALARAAAPA